MEFIIGYPLSDFTYMTVVRLIKMKREGKPLVIARGRQKTSLPITALLLDGILPRETIFEEVVGGGDENKQF